MIDTKDDVTASANAAAQKRNKSEKAELKQLVKQQEKEHMQQMRHHHNRTNKIEAHKKQCAKLALRVKWAEENLSHARSTKNQERLSRTLNHAKENHALTCASPPR
jgi:chromosome segregation ATPase